MFNANSPEVVAFVAGVQAMQNKWQEGATVGMECFITTMEVQEGPKRLRIVKTEDINGKEPRRSVHCFIDRETGDILKAAGWKAPAPRGKRGSITAPDFGLSCVNSCSVRSRR
jgi:hypothetical protein